jgi:PHD/YefM family antitoxin component YafN of YafNO toxin-antitoxin module
MAEPEIQYVQNEEGETTAVIVPIELWREMSSERETQYLLSNETMRRRLTEAMKDDRKDIPGDEALAKLGLSLEGL